MRHSITKLMFESILVIVFGLLFGELHTNILIFKSDLETVKKINECKQLKMSYSNVLVQFLRKSAVHIILSSPGKSLSLCVFDTTMQMYVAAPLPDRIIRCPHHKPST